MTDQAKRIRITHEGRRPWLTSGRVYDVIGWEFNGPKVCDDDGDRINLHPSQWEPAPDEPARPKRIRIMPECEWSGLTECKTYDVIEWNLEGFPAIRDDDGDIAVIPIEHWWEPMRGEPDAAPAVSPGASALLREAAGIVEGARNATHGEKERSFAAIADVWNAYVSARKQGGPLTARDVAACMVLLKLVRSVQGTPARDHFVDAAGYAAICGEIAEGEKHE